MSGAAESSSSSCRRRRSRPCATRCSRPAPAGSATYERCSWYTEGTGTFRALPGANPAVGEVGEEERVRRAAARDGVPGGAPRRRRRRAPRRAPVRGAGLRHLRAACEGASLHRRRRARQSRPGRVRLRARGRGRNGARRRTARRSASRRTTSPSTAASSPGSRRRSSWSVLELEVVIRLGAAREADARRVQGQERGAAQPSPSRPRASPAGSTRSSTSTSVAPTTSSPTGSSTRPWTAPLPSLRRPGRLGRADRAPRRRGCDGELAVRTP